VAAAFVDGWKEPRSEQGRVAVTGTANRAHRGGDGSDISVAAELGHQAAAGAERAMDAGDHKLGLPHPVQGGIGEHSVELRDEVQRVPVHFADGEPLHARNCEQLVAQIDAKHIGAGRLDLFRQRAVAAAKIENALAWLRHEHGEYGARHLLNEAPVLCIIRCRPALNGLW